MERVRFPTERLGRLRLHGSGHHITAFGQTTQPANNGSARSMYLRLEMLF